MIESILTTLGALILTPIVFLSTFFTQPLQQPVIQDEALGVQLPSGTALFETSLASPITTSASTLTLVSNSIRGGASLSGYQCFTIDEGSAQAEFVCGTVSGTSVTGLERGLSPEDGVTQVTALQFSHRRGASVKITDFPLIQRLKSQASGSGTYESVLSYASGVTPSGSDELADVGYVLSTISGTSTLAFDKLSPGGTAGETMSTGTIVYFKKSDQRWYKLDVDDSTHYTDTEIGCTGGPGTTANTISGGVILHGLCPQVGLTAGANYFASSTAGATSTATTSQPIGVARSTTQLYFNPHLISTTVNVPTTFSATTTFTSSVVGSGGRFPFTASSTFTGATTPQAAFLSPSSTASTTSASATTTSGFSGFAVTSASVGGTVQIVSSGVIDGFTSLTKGALYYTQANPGTIDITPTTYSVPVGFAVSTTQLNIEPGRRTETGVIQTLGTNSGASTIGIGFRPKRIRLMGSVLDNTSTVTSMECIWTTQGLYGTYRGTNGTTGSQGSGCVMLDGSVANYMTITISGVGTSSFTLTWTETNTYQVDSDTIVWVAEE